MHGFPIAIKDLANAEGFVTTSGSPIFKSNVAEADSLHVARMKAAGGIVIGKTNVPEFGLGSDILHFLPEWWRMRAASSDETFDVLRACEER